VNASVDDIVHTVLIDARPETVWSFWVEPDRMARWWGAAELEPKPNGRYRVTMPTGQVMEGEYVELVPHERLVFRFGWEGDRDVAPRSTMVEVTLSEQDGGTLLTLRHRGLPAASRHAHTDGWDHFLSVLVQAAGGLRT
jgi:uncharacterized protein YndB with AHSA1/START domain